MVSRCPNLAAARPPPPCSGDGIQLSMLPRLRPADALYSRFSIANYGHSDGYNRVLADASVDCITAHGFSESRLHMPSRKTSSTRPVHIQNGPLYDGVDISFIFDRDR